MKIEARLEKAELECLEGLNHLWIHLGCVDCSTIVNFRLHLDFPDGICLLKNLNDFPEDQSHTVTVPKVDQNLDMVFELFTEKKLPLGRIFLTLFFSFQDHGQFCKGQKQIPLTIVSEESSDKIIMDQEVVSLVEKIEKNREQGYTFETFPKVIQETLTELSPLERKYRIDGVCGAV